MTTLLTLGLLWTLGAPAQGALPPGEFTPFALLVASNEGGPDFASLRYAHRDAERVRDVFHELGALADPRTQVLLGPDSDDLRQAMQAMHNDVQKAKTAGQTVLLLFYYSGHAKDGQLLLGDESLAMDEIKRWLGQSPADLRVAFVDACQAGEFTRMKGGSLAPSIVKVENTQGQIIVTSSSATEGSQESDEIGGSFFTHYLVSGLRGAADHSQDGLVSLREVYDYTYHQVVARTTGSRGGTQHPTYGYQMAGRGNIILTRLSTPSCRISFPADLEGEYLIYDQQKQVIVAELSKKSGKNSTIAVESGIYAIKKRRSTDLLLGEFVLVDGQNLELRDQDLLSVAYENDITKGLVAIRKKTRYIGYSLRFGSQAFFDKPTREELFYTVAQAGLQIEFFGVVSDWVSLTFDVLLGGGSNTTTVRLDNGFDQRVEAAFFRAEFGSGLHFHYQLGNFDLFAGPRLSFLLAVRSLGPPLELWPTQSFGTLSPGITAGCAYHLGDFDFFLESRVHYLYYNIGSNASMGYGGIYLGFSYRS